jgi:hypothetical protein
VTKIGSRAQELVENFKQTAGFWQAQQLSSIVVRSTRITAQCPQQYDKLQFVATTRKQVP